jgi:hypothetical protein
MYELTLELGKELIGGHAEVVCDLTADGNFDYEILAIRTHDDNGDEINLWGMLLIESFNKDVDVEIREQLEKLKEGK